MSMSTCLGPGSVKVVKPKKAAKLVEQVARDTEDPRSSDRAAAHRARHRRHRHPAGRVAQPRCRRRRRARPSRRPRGDDRDRTQLGGHARHPASVLQIAPEFVVCSNGAVVLREWMPRPELRAVPHRDVRSHRGADAAARAPARRASYLVELPDGQPALHRVPRRLEPRRTPSEVAFEQLGAQPVCRIVVVAPEHGEQDFVDLVSRIGLNQVSYAVGWTAWLDIAPQGVDKSTGLEIVRTELGIDPAHVLVIGDGRNDLGMFRWALRERRPRRRDGAGSARGSGCRGRDDHVGRGRRRRRGAAQALSAQSSSARADDCGAGVPAAFRGLPGVAGRMGEQCCRLDSTPVRRMPRHRSGGLSERPMDLVLKTSGQQCPVGSNPTPSAD